MREDELLVPPPSGASRRRVSFVLGTVVLLQVLVPLRYYAGGDPFDERFVWRMFSSRGGRPCAYALSEETVTGARRPVRVDAVLGVHWHLKLEQHQPRVVAAVLRSRCGRGDVSAAHYERRCRRLDGARLPVERRTLRCVR